MTDQTFLLSEQSMDVRDGALAGSASWVYVWLRPGKKNEVLYVGATQLPPVVRTWLHLHHDDPEIGRIRSRQPDAPRGDLTVRAFELRPDLDRHKVKQALLQIQQGGRANNPDASWRAAAAIAARLQGPARPSQSQ